MANGKERGEVEWKGDALLSTLTEFRENNKAEDGCPYIALSVFKLRPLRLLTLGVAIAIRIYITTQLSVSRGGGTSRLRDTRGSSKFLLSLLFKPLVMFYCLLINNINLTLASCIYIFNIAVYFLLLP